MAKYILKQEAVYALINEANTHNNPVKRAYTRAAAIIEGITGKEVQPVKHGEWLKVSWNNYKCSLCDTQYAGMGAITFNFCPACGAKMIKDGDTD